jgi:hypothetical protein
MGIGHPGGGRSDWGSGGGRSDLIVMMVVNL